MRYGCRLQQTVLAIGALAIACASASASDWNAHAQATYIEQHKNAFDADYSGPRSLSTDAENSYSFTATAFLGLHAWSGGELYIDPEVTRGVALSNLNGLGAFTNGEMARTSGPSFKFYRARLFLRQTFNLSGDNEQLDDEPNQLKSIVTAQRFVFTLGNVSMLDVFDPNRFSHDGRTQFFNWALITYGAFDFAADSRGYTWAAIGEWYHNDWVIRAGRGLLPQTPNGEALDAQWLHHYGDQLEMEHRYRVNGNAGAMHLLAFHDRTQMARYRDALALARASQTIPDINAVRTNEQNKYGIGIAIEQDFTSTIGGFARAMWADGQSETEAYATIDRTISVGMVAHGATWHRAADTVGMAFSWDTLSSSARQYFEAGGIGFFVGDGRMRYAPEQLYEAYYDFQLASNWWLTADLQRIVHPAFNADRGPVTLPAIRIHAEF